MSDTKDDPTSASSDMPAGPSDHVSDTPEKSGDDIARDGDALVVETKMEIGAVAQAVEGNAERAHISSRRSGTLDLKGEEPTERLEVVELSDTGETLTSYPTGPAMLALTAPAILAWCNIEDEADAEEGKEINYGVEFVLPTDATVGDLKALLFVQMNRYPEMFHLTEEFIDNLDGTFEDGPYAGMSMAEHFFNVTYAVGAEPAQDQRKFLDFLREDFGLTQEDVEVYLPIKYI